MRIHIARFPSSAAFAVGAFLGILVCALFTREQVLNDHKKYLQDYGQSLANMAARQAIDATFNHDLVRLQVILQDTLAYPRVFIATLHDVENNLLVQAGQANHIASKEVTYTSAVVLQDSIAGYLSIGMDASVPNNTALTILFYVCEGLLILIALVLLLKKGEVQFNATTEEASSISHADDSTETPSDPTGELMAEQSEASQADSEVEAKTVCANFFISNHDLLAQQLSKDTYSATMQYLEMIIIKVSTLYNAEYFKISDHSSQIFFEFSEEQNDADFRAVCSAILVRRLSNVINHIPLEISSFVSSEHAVDIHCPSDFGIAIDKSLLIDDHALQKIVVHDLGEAMITWQDESEQSVDLAELQGLISPYDKLVEKQSEQLQLILQSTRQ